MLEKKEIILEYQRSDGDTGSPEVQIALLTARIKMLTEHFKVHKKDKHSRLGLLNLVSQRKRLLRYLEKIDVQRYRTLKQSLQLR